MLSRVFQRRKDPNIMDRGTYSELNQNDVPVELEAENVPLTESEAEKTYPREGERRIDYVLVYETCKEKEEDEDTKKKAATLARSRRSYEKRLQKKGLVLQRESVVVEKVLPPFCFYLSVLHVIMTVIMNTEIVVLYHAVKDL